VLKEVPNMGSITTLS
jgi:hypothetical protein